MADRLFFLAELDDLTDNETDASAFSELAVVFDEIGAAAAEAAAALRFLEMRLISTRRSGQDSRPPTL